MEWHILSSSKGDNLGESVSGYRFDAFGSMFAGVLAPYSTAGITGKTYDATTGLIDFGARSYDPSLGRFTQPDTFKGVATKPLTQNPYAYVGATGLAKQGAIYAAIKIGLDGIVKLSGGSDRQYAGPWDKAPSLGTNNGSATYSAQWGARFVTKKALGKVIQHLKDPKLLRWFKPFLSPKAYETLDRYRWDIVYALQPLLKYNELLTNTVVNTVRNTLLDLGVRSSTAETISWIVGKALEWI